jgi:hypothetical protein
MSARLYAALTAALVVSVALAAVDPVADFYRNQTVSMREG